MRFRGPDSLVLCEMEGRFVKKCLRFHKYPASWGLNLKKSFIMQIDKKKSLVKG